SPAPVLLLDEPCAGRDLAPARAVYATLAEAARGRSGLLLVHRLSGAERIGRVWRLQSGHAVAAAS
ncbi:cysteine/glutathione ABC transporter ATP-binding protein/permease CydC, partial [Salmonella enterica subsp. enterica serovar Enteritidis]